MFYVYLIESAANQGQRYVGVTTTSASGSWTTTPASHPTLQSSGHGNWSPTLLSAID